MGPVGCMIGVGGMRRGMVHGGLYVWGLMVRSMAQWVVMLGNARLGLG